MDTYTYVPDRIYAIMDVSLLDNPVPAGLCLQGYPIENRKFLIQHRRRSKYAPPPVCLCCVGQCVRLCWRTLKNECSKSSLPFVPQTIILVINVLVHAKILQYNIFTLRLAHNDKG